MDFSKISYGEVKNFSASLKQNASSMDALLKDITTQFNKIGDDGVWSGDAAGAAKQEFDSLSSRFHEFNEAINECAKYLDQVVANYEALDAQVKNIQI